MVTVDRHRFLKSTTALAAVAALRLGLASAEDLGEAARIDRLLGS